MLPIEEHLVEYNAYLGFVYGYGFEGKTYQKVPYDGPRSKEIVTRWLKFWKDHAPFFKQGYLLHVRQPQPGQLDSVAHVFSDPAATAGAPPITPGAPRRSRALLVAYNPTANGLTDSFEIHFWRLDLPAEGWQVVPNVGAPASFQDGQITLTVPSLDAVWCELEIIHSTRPDNS